MDVHLSGPEMHDLLSELDLMFNGRMELWDYFQVKHRRRKNRVIGKLPYYKSYSSSHNSWHFLGIILELNSTTIYYSYQNCVYFYFNVTIFLGCLLYF